MGSSPDALASTGGMCHPPEHHTLSWQGSSWVGGGLYPVDPECLPGWKPFFEQGTTGANCFPTQLTAFQSSPQTQHAQPTVFPQTLPDVADIITARKKNRGREIFS